MSFSTNWLDLREPVDLRSRNADVIEAMAAHFSSAQKLDIVDIACGTGSTLRALSDPVFQSAHWTLIDHDPALLEAAAERTADVKRAVTTRLADIDTDLGLIFNEETGLVTTSAFLDLVSHDWSRRLVTELTRLRLPFYAALSFNGRMNCDPPHQLDEGIFKLVLKHQRTDKGFGPALGPDAAATVIVELEQAGFSVVQGPSDWRFNPDEGLVQSMLIQGWADAALEMSEFDSEADDKLDAEAIADWRDWHLTRIAEGATSILVGHVDFFAMPGALPRY